MQNFYINIKKVLILSIQMGKKSIKKIEQSDQQKLKLSPSTIYTSTLQIADLS